MAESVAVKLFDYEAVAELFPARSRKFNRQFARYRRFDSAADALRFAIEDLPPQLLLGAYLEVEEERFDSNEMRGLYNSTEFPLARRAAVFAQDRDKGAQQLHAAVAKPVVGDCDEGGSDEGGSD